MCFSVVEMIFAPLLEEFAETFSVVKSSPIKIPIKSVLALVLLRTVVISVAVL